MLWTQSCQDGVKDYFSCLYKGPGATNDQCDIRHIICKLKQVAFTRVEVAAVVLFMRWKLYWHIELIGTVTATNTISGESVYYDRSSTSFC